MLRRLAIVFAAAAAVFIPVPRGLVERAYSTGVYPRLQSIVTPASNSVPFALFDALIVVILVAWLWALVADMRRDRGGWLYVGARVVLRTLVWSAALYLVFLAVWGLNYRRTKLVDKLQFDSRAVSAAAARSAGGTATTELNRLYDRARTGPERTAEAAQRSLTAAFVRIQEQLGIRLPAAPGRPKPTILEPYFRLAAVSGMTDPYLLETLITNDLLPFERPFVIAHEWAHLAGYADESEANFVGWLTCMRGSAEDQYSGWLFLYGELTRAVTAHDGAELGARLAPGPRADLLAIVHRLQRQVSPTVSAAGWRANDLYLKANRVKAGAASYGEVVRLVLGVRFGPDWTPQLARGGR